GTSAIERQPANSVRIPDSAQYQSALAVRDPDRAPCYGGGLLDSVVADRSTDKSGERSLSPLDRGAASRKLVRRPVTGVFRRWNHGCPHHTIGQVAWTACHLSYFDHAVQELAQAAA